MASDPVIDVEALLQPIAGESPTGEELSIAEPDGLFMKTKDAWDEARKLVKEEQDRERNGGIDSQGQTWRVIPPPDWEKVIDLGTEILTSRSKDFRVAAWLTEALLRRHHAAGLRDGLKICNGLCQNFWDQIRPSPNEEDGHSVTVGAFSALVSEATFSAILAIPVAIGQKPGEREFKSYSALDHQRARDMAELVSSEERESRMEMGHVTTSEFDSVVAVTDREYHDNLIADLNESIGLLSEVGSFLGQNCQPDSYGDDPAPGITPFREELESVVRLVRELRGEDAAEESSESEQGVSVVGGGVQGSVMTREAAFQAIERIAQFFERTEPHTPVHFSLRQAIRWGRMPLPELLAELIEDGHSMERLRKVVGLPTPPEDA